MLKKILLASLLSTCAFSGGFVAVALGVRGHLTGIALAQPPAQIDVSKIGERFEAVAKRVSPSVVYIETTKTAAKGKSTEESGSGVLVRFDGQRGQFVLTNNHVVAQATAEQVTIHASDGRLFRPNRIWADPESDVAVLRVEGAEHLGAVPLGDSDRMRVGQWVLAFGSPFGLNQTVTHGIISARDRGQISLGNQIRIKDFLQTDAAINPGSSGGPLVNLDGEVIGINTAIASQSGNNSGVAFSIPINLARHVAKQLLEKGSVSRGYLGLQLAPSFEPADALRLGLDRVQGALVETVYGDTPAAAAGLKANDIVLEVDGITIRNENHLINMISSFTAGQKVRMIVWRDRKKATVDAVVGDWAKAQTRFKN